VKSRSHDGTNYIIIYLLSFILTQSEISETGLLKSILQLTSKEAYEIGIIIKMIKI